MPPTQAPTPPRDAKAGDEIERKFLIPRLPPRLGALPHAPVEQGYLAVCEDGTEVRVRRHGRRHFITVKAPGGMSRRETEIAITRRQFDALWPATAERRVSKTRYRVEVGGHTAEVDVYRGPLRGLNTAEVEFPSPRAAERFEPPEWFGPEVTGDIRYKNQTLARDGKPAQ